MESDPVVQFQDDDGSGIKGQGNNMDNSEELASKGTAATAASPGQSQNGEDSQILEDWGFTLKDVYGLALTFFKDKDGKAMHLSYEERLKLVALSLQVSHGKFDPSTASPLGVLDVIGKDRRVAWQALGEKSKADSMSEFITFLSKQSPLFKPFVEAHKRDLEEKGRLRNVLLAAEQEELKEYQIAKEIQNQVDAAKYLEEEQKRRVQDALNRQTFAQFKLYAEQQYPGNPEQQGVLIRQLQEQHYEQYMRQIFQQQLYVDESNQLKVNPSLPAENILSPHQKGQTDQERSDEPHSDIPDDNDSASANKPTSTNGNEAEENQESEEQNENGGSSNIASASMWTRKDLKEFKESVRAEGGEAIIRIGQGESVTVRVPTHEEGSCLFWEFATDSYDIGFGLFFEWTNADEPVSVQVTEENSSDDEDDDEAFQALQQDVERGRELLPKDAKPNTEVVIPVYRRDAHQEVYVGSHIFPGKGVYLLKFDNSYSFWRSKTLYYRVYYTK